ncbi:hypothetical protein [Salinifilum aidingensis]
MKDPNETVNTVKTHVMRAVTGGLTAIKTTSDSASALFERADALDGRPEEMDRMAKAADHSSDAAEAKVAAVQTVPREKSRMREERGRGGSPRSWVGEVISPLRARAST